MTADDTPKVLMSGIAFGEQPRWHDARLWFSDWGPGDVIAADLDGRSEVMLHVGSFPCCADWLPDGRMLVVSTRDGLLLRQEPDGSLATHGNLATVSSPPAGNELVVDARASAYVNGGGFNLAAGEPFAPGIIALATPDGTVRQVADGLAFPNGMLITEDGDTLIVAESYSNRLTAFDVKADGSLSNRRV
jgi:sugar lactone lactonase YvrE